jgi:hypothetical protein
MRRRSEQVARVHQFVDALKESNAQSSVRSTALLETAEGKRSISAILRSQNLSADAILPPEVMDSYCIIDATRSPRYTGTREHDSAVPKIFMQTMAQARLRARMGASGGVLADGRLAL